MDNGYGTMIIDDHPIFRLGLRRALEGSRLRVVAEAGSGVEAMDTLRHVIPEIVLLDLGLPGRSGFEVCRDLLMVAPDVCVLVLSSYDDSASIRASRAAGARGHLPKDAPSGVIVGRAVWLCEHPESVWFTSLESTSLSGRELDVLEAMALGLRQPEIAARLGIGGETVRSYIRGVYDKLGVNDRVAALEVARATKLIGSPPSRGYRP